MEYYWLNPGALWVIFRGSFWLRSQTRRVNQHGNAIPGLRLQRDDLLAQRAAPEDDLSTSFVQKFDLENKLSSARAMIKKEKACCEPRTPAYYSHPLKLAGNSLIL